MSAKAENLIEAIGGKDNISDIESCITRLRIEVAEPAKVDEEALRRAGAFGVVIQDSVLQVVVGPEADDLSEAMTKAIG
ncbi:MAG: PTS glucose/sucrose transporter subunit IIB [Actinomycetaceae bacterium]|nr:PTS glucose/sucrose transporter subunit IIB [Actinomycetaceae bacterium]